MGMASSDLEAMPTILREGCATVGHSFIRATPLSSACTSWGPVFGELVAGLEVTLGYRLVVSFVALHRSSAVPTVWVGVVAFRFSSRPACMVSNRRTAKNGTTCPSTAAASPLFVPEVMPPRMGDLALQSWGA